MTVLAIMLLVASATWMAAAAYCIRIDGGTPREWYRSLKREIADELSTKRYTWMPCPQQAIVIAVLGQSNAANHIEGARVPANKNIPAFVRFRGRCFALEDPVPGSTGEAGSLWTLFAHRLAADTGRPVVVIAGAADGSSVTDWTNPAWFHTPRVARAIADARASGMAPDLIFWHQGESDAVSRTAGRDYGERLGHVIERFTKVARGPGGLPPNPQRIKPRWVVFQASLCYDHRNGSAEIRAAQAAIADPARGIHAGPNTDDLGDAYRHDHCHFNAAGRTRIVDDLMAMLAREQILPRSGSLPRT